MGLADAFAPLLLGTWFASILSGLVASEAYKYFTSFPMDSWRRKGFVILVLAFTLVALIGDYANTYLPTVAYWGDTTAIEQTYWPLPLYSISNTILAIIVDAYLIHRFYALWVTYRLMSPIHLTVERRSKNIVATIFLYMVLLLALAGYIIGFIPLVRSSTLAVRNNAKIGATISFISFVVCDMFTAVGLIWKLRTMKSSFADTNSLMNRVMVIAIQTGSATSLCSILLLITFLKNPESNVPTFFIFLFAPLYSLTLMVNFNIRRSSGSSSASKTSQSRGGNNNIVMEGIQIHRTAIVTMDPTDSEQETARRRMEDSDGKQDLDLESLGARKAQLRP
ncbi:hypothetical protein K438DRAFT_2017640 [Mycena galopus ATCC 62051]|nr:hypothetical protein K438DRAFT_2017640 [Mycena galopus ATCC 62051]